ncbi:Exodeoxyribonuclease III [Streptococcus sp. DD12]|nr:Exodeoxyribonuclease III [Streptococcus sp. DD12]
MKILTLNTHSWMEEHPQEKLEQLVDTLAEKACDLIFLQEINQLISSEPAEVTPGYVAVSDSPAIHVDNYALLLVTALRERGLDYYWSWAYNHIGYDKYQEGVAILSLTPLHPRLLRVSDSTDETDYRTRCVLLAQTHLSGHPYLVASVHLSWWEKGFAREWLRLERALEEAQLPVIVAGDFNNPVAGPGYQLMTSGPLELADSHKQARVVSGEHTIQAAIDGWEGNRQQLKVDHILLSQGIPVSLSQVVFDGGNTPQVSDHFGVFAVLDV